MSFVIKNCRMVYRKARGTDISAALVESSFFPNGEEWFPWSVIHDDSEVYRVGDYGTLIVEDWWAEKKGWYEPGD